SENFLKLFLLIIFVIAVFIPASTTNKSIINWEYVSLFNYIKAIFIIVSCAFLPGANLYSIFFRKDEISKKFAIESFFVKITLYPLISFGFIGIVVLIFDQVGIIRDFIGLFLVVTIIFLCLIDIFLQKLRVNNIELEIIRIKISKNVCVILLFTFAISLISIGFQIGWSYLPPGDPWDGIKYANHIGIMGTSPIYIDYYPNFWGYVSFGYSILTGLPYINVNTLMAPFNYLFVASVYLFMKSLLF
ncbi:unnamed protein product, partial [marine sediment metagenome]